jgi:hypothetical protein
LVSLVTWPCEAYGPEGPEFGAVCFIGDLNRRVCESSAECHATVQRERERVYGRLQELAATGDPGFVALAAEFTSPDQLLNGRRDGE